MGTSIFTLNSGTRFPVSNNAVADRWRPASPISEFIVLSVDRGASLMATLRFMPRRIHHSWRPVDPLHLIHPTFFVCIARIRIPLGWSWPWP